MGTYRNPNIIVNTDARIVPQNSGSSIISDMGSELRKAAAANKARRDANWASYKRNNELALAYEEDFISQGLKEGLDRQQLEGQASVLMRNYAAALNKDSQATGPYEGYEENARFIFQTKQALKDVPSVFSAMSLNVEEYGKALTEKGQGSAPGQVNYRFTDPLYAAMVDIANNKPGSSGKVSWDVVYTPESGHQWFQVAKGEDIKRLNEQMYKSTGNKKYLDAGDEYRVSYTEIARAQEDSDGNINDNTTFMTNPNIMSDLKDGIAAGNFIDEETGTIAERFQNTKLITRGSSIEGDGGEEVAVQTSPNIEAIKSDPRFRSLVKTYANTQTRYGPNTLSAYIETATKQKNINGETLFFYPDPVSGENIQVGNDEGYFELDQSEENAQRNGYSEKDYNSILGLVEHDLLNRIGAFSAGTVQRDDTRTKALAVEKRSRANANSGSRTPKYVLEGKRRKNLINASLEILADQDATIDKRVASFEQNMAGISQKEGVDFKFYPAKDGEPDRISVGKKKLVKVKEEVLDKDKNIVEQAQYKVMHEPFQFFGINDEEKIRKYLEDRFIGYDQYEEENSTEVKDEAARLIEEAEAEAEAEITK